MPPAQRGSDHGGTVRSMHIIWTMVNSNRLSGRQRTIRYLLTLLLLGFCAVGHAADYSRCATFFNNPPDTNGDGFAYRVEEEFNGSYVPRRYRSLPVKLNSDGTVSVINPEYLIDRTTSPDGLRTKFVYQSPPLDLLEDMDAEDVRQIEEHRSADTPASITVVRAARNGPIVEIIEEVPRSSNVQTQSSHTVVGTRTLFEMKNGECLPTMSSQILMRSDGKKTQVITFVTSLCRDIQKFVRQHPEVSEVFDYRLGKKMNEIFLDHEDKVFPPDPSPYEPLQTQDESVEEMNKLLYVTPHLAAQMLAGYTAGEKFIESDKARFGRSSILSAHMALATCRFKGLMPFINNDNLWSD